MLKFAATALILALASYAHAQGFGGSYGGGNPYSNGDDSGDDGGYTSSNGSQPPVGFESFFSQYKIKVTAHAVLATLAFGLFFPVGGIMIRIASFPGLWWVHGLFQVFAYLLYIAAFGIGVHMASNMRMLNGAHPIIGIVLFVLLFFQPFLGLLHHVMFKKHSRRVVWSYGHIWLGRAIITLGIINGGLGLRLSEQTHFFAPHQGTIVAYSVVAGIIWLLYMAAAIVGEVKRSGNTADNRAAPPAYRAGETHRLMTQYA